MLRSPDRFPQRFPVRLRIQWLQPNIPAGQVYTARPLSGQRSNFGANR